jgi:hypothetical protein
MVFSSSSCLLLPAAAAAAAADSAVDCLLLVVVLDACVDVVLPREGVIVWPPRRADMNGRRELQPLPWRVSWNRSFWRWSCREWMLIVLLSSIGISVGACGSIVLRLMLQVLGAIAGVFQAARLPHRDNNTRLVEANITYWLHQFSLSTVELLANQLSQQFKTRRLG